MSGSPGPEAVTRPARTGRRPAAAPAAHHPLHCPTNPRADPSPAHRLTSDLSADAPVGQPLAVASQRSCGNQARRTRPRESEPKLQRAPLISRPVDPSRRAVNVCATGQQGRAPALPLQAGPRSRQPVAWLRPEVFATEFGSFAHTEAVDSCGRPRRQGDSAAIGRDAAVSDSSGETAWTRCVLHATRGVDGHGRC
jgi:hypothetical protein